MIQKAEQERVHMLLKDTITLLCKNGLSFKSEFSIEALIGITLDKNDVFLININEIIRSEASQKAAEHDRFKDTCSEEESDLNSGESSREGQLRRKRRKRRHKQIKTEASTARDETFSAENNNDNGEQRTAFRANQDDSQQEEAADDRKSIKQDKDDQSVEDIIIIKEETNESWSQFGDVSTFPSGSGTELPESVVNEQALVSPSSSFLQSQPAGIDWSQSSINQTQFAAGTSTLSGDPNQQALGAELPCEICGKVLRKRSSLFVHLKLHQGKYNYNCPICHKGFTSKSMLQGHMSWHTGVKEFKCAICQKEFRYPQDLRRHMAKMHGESAEQLN